MQYILTEEEYNNLVDKQQYNHKCEKVNELNKLVLKLSKFKCIHDRKEYGDFYCDRCPLSETGTCDKEKEFGQ